MAASTRREITAGCTVPLQISLWGKQISMIRFFIYAAVIVGLLLWGHSCWQDSVTTKNNIRAQEQRKQALKASVIEMASKDRADMNWASNLTTGNRIRKSPVLTAELQKQWITNHPILVIGYIEDISINPDGAYQVVVEYDGLEPNTVFFVMNEIKVSLSCPESITAPLIQSVKKGKSEQNAADVAITGTIETVNTTTKTDSQGESTTVLTGFGRCMNAIYLPERLPR